MNNFYIYRYIRLDTNTPFYIGKGKGHRASGINKHNEYCKNIAKKFGFRIEYIMNYISEDQAFAKEVEFISLYKSYGWCEANFTDGGEGRSGYQLTEETKKKISKNTKKRHQDPEFRKRHRKATKEALNRPEVKAKISTIQKEIKNKPKVKAKAVVSSIKQWEEKLKDKLFNVYISICIQKAKPNQPAIYERGELVGVYYNQRTCAKDLNICYKNMATALKGKRKMHKGYIFEYIKED